MLESSAAYSRRIKERIDLGTEGTVVSFTRVHESMKNFNRNVLYILALIQLEDKSFRIGEIVDNKGVKEGSRVMSCFRRVYTDQQDGMVNYGIKWVVK